MLAQKDLTSESAVRTASYFEKIPRVPVPKGPFLFLNKEEIASARLLSEKEQWARTLKENFIRIADTWLSRDYDFIKWIIPVKGSLYTYGVGMDLDPIQQKK